LDACIEPKERTTIQKSSGASSAVGDRPDNLPSWLVLSLSLIRNLPQQVFFGPCQVRHFHETSGRIQCMRNRFDGEPNWLGTSV